MKNPIQAIIDFNVKAGFINDKSNFTTFSDYKESAYLIEEALEPYGVKYISKLLTIDTTKEDYIKNPQRSVAKAILVHTETNMDALPTKVELVDKYLDAIVYAIGSLGKMGLTHQDITAALNIVTEANLRKTINPIYDEAGKLLKPDDWYRFDPEVKLLNLIEKRGL